MNLFRKKVEKSNELNGELSNLEEKLQQLEKKEKWLQSKIDSETQTALENKTKNKAAAIAALERRKKLQADIDQCRSQQQNLMAIKTSVSNALGLKDEMLMYKEAQAIFKKVSSNITVEEVEKAKDQLQEEMQKVTDIRNALSSRLDDGILIDEDDLERELAELGQEIEVEDADLERELDLLGTAPQISAAEKALQNAPLAPRTPIQNVKSRAKSSEEDELAELQASMAS